jgi:hypothetical protein
MAAKMQYFTNSYSIKLDNRHILNLDAEVKNMTLRKYLMSRAPKDSVIQRYWDRHNWVESVGNIRATSAPRECQQQQQQQQQQQRQ